MLPREYAKTPVIQFVEENGRETIAIVLYPGLADDLEKWWKEYESKIDPTFFTAKLEKESSGVLKIRFSRWASRSHHLAVVYAKVMLLDYAWRYDLPPHSVGETTGDIELGQVLTSLVSDYFPSTSLNPELRQKIVAEAAKMVLENQQTLE